MQDRTVGEMRAFDEGYRVGLAHAEGLCVVEDDPRVGVIIRKRIVSIDAMVSARDDAPPEADDVVHSQQQ